MRGVDENLKVFICLPFLFDEYLIKHKTKGSGEEWKRNRITYLYTYICIKRKLQGGYEHTHIKTRKRKCARKKMSSEKSVESKEI